MKKVKVVVITEREHSEIVSEGSDVEGWHFSKAESVVVREVGER